MNTTAHPARPLWPSLPPLPVDALLPPLLHSLATCPNAVVNAPAGSGKSSRVPLAVAQAPWLRPRKRVLLLEPRRLAARSLARYMAHLLGEEVGGRVGYRMRLESRTSAHTVVEVITEGVLARQLVNDPELDGVGCIILDEFHERSLHADVALTLCLEAQRGFRPDVRLLVMSATLDVQPGRVNVRSLLGEGLAGGCPVFTCPGQAWPVDVRYAPPPAGASPLVPAGARALEAHVAAVTRQALCAGQGDILVFLPGAPEIRRVAALLGEAALPPVDICPLYGDLPAAEQDAALRPHPRGGRKVVLATSIAETSLTIEGVRCVIDAGLARRACFDPSLGMERLKTERVCLASAEQRKGRAGRLEAGVAWRLWAPQEEQHMRSHTRPEILDADLAPLLLLLADWGVTNDAALAALPWLTPPPAAAVQVARNTLRALDALDAQGRLTPEGRKLMALPVHPRLAHMLVHSSASDDAPLAACVAALLSDRLPRGGQRDAGHCLPDALRALCAPGGGDFWQRQRRLARSLHASAVAARASMPDTAFFTQALRRAEAPDALGALLALAFPQWIAVNVGCAPPDAHGPGGDFRLREGRAATLPPHDSLAQCPCIAVARLEGGQERARIAVAAPLSQAKLERLFAAALTTRDVVRWDARSQAVLLRRETRLDALLLASAPLVDASTAEVAQALVAGIADVGLHVLPWTDALRQWQGRVACLRRLEPDIWPDVSDAALAASLGQWLAPWLGGMTQLAQVKKVDLPAALHSLLPPALARRLEREAPARIRVPSGQERPVDYSVNPPALHVKLQEMFGANHTPAVAGGRVPLCVHLLSPARRPLQITQDLPHFWREVYPQVRAEMRGRYPRHPWPDDPCSATPTHRAKPRGGAGG